MYNLGNHGIALNTETVDHGQAHGNVGVPNKHTTGNLKNAASRRTTVYHCMADVTTSLARSLHNGAYARPARGRQSTLAKLDVVRAAQWRGVESGGGSDRTQIWVRRRALRLSHRAWRFDAAPGPTDPVASEKGGNPWSGVRHGCPSHSLRAYVGVPVSGTCCIVRVQENVGGGGRLQVAWMYASFEASIFTKRVPEPHAYHAKPIHSKRRPTYALDKSTDKYHVQRWLVAVEMRADAEMQRDHLKINGLRDDKRMRLDRVHTGCTRLSFIDTFTCKLPRRLCEGG